VAFDLDPVVYNEHINVPLLLGVLEQDLNHRVVFYWLSHLGRYLFFLHHFEVLIIGLEHVIPVAHKHFRPSRIIVLARFIQKGVENAVDIEVHGFCQFAVALFHLTGISAGQLEDLVLEIV